MGGIASKSSMLATNIKERAFDGHLVDEQGSSTKKTAASFLESSQGNFVADGSGSSIDGNRTEINPRGMKKDFVTRYKEFLNVYAWVQ